MDVNAVALGRRIRELREATKVQGEACAAIGVSQPTYSRIEAGTRPLTGDELIQLADHFGVRASAITGIAAVRERAQSAARTGGGNSAMDSMRERLCAYLELDAYLTDQGIAKA